MRKAQDEIPIGKRFNRLVIKRELASRNRARYIEVTCDCGTSLEVRWQNVKHGMTRSCRQQGPRCS